MSFSMFSDFLNYLNEKFSGQIPNLIFFGIGLAFGILLFLILFLIIFLVSKSKQRIKEKLNNEHIEIKEEYKHIIELSKEEYINKYFDADIKTKVTGIGKIILNMMESIATLYYPDSKDPIFEVSLERLVDFLSYTTSRLNYIIDHLLEEKFQIVDVLTNHSIKDKKISFIFEMIDKKKKPETEEFKEKKIGFFGKIKQKFVKVGKKVATKIGGHIINSELNSIIDSLGEDMNKLYSNQKLEFTDLTKKELKMLRKEKRLALKSISKNNGGDVNVD